MHGTFPRWNTYQKFRIAGHRLDLGFESSIQIGCEPKAGNDLARRERQKPMAWSAELNRSDRDNHRIHGSTSSCFGSGGWQERLPAAATKYGSIWNYGPTGVWFWWPELTETVQILRRHQDCLGTAHWEAFFGRKECSQKFGPIRFFSTGKNGTLMYVLEGPGTWK